MSIDLPAPYWTNESLSITVQNGDGTRQFSLDQPFALLGTHPNCDLVLEDEGIERRSLVITLGPSSIHGIVLCASAKKAGRVFALEENRAFKLGRYQISVSRQGSVEQPVVESQTGETVSVISWKTSRGRLHAQLPNHRPVVLGRRDPARIVVEDDTMSGLHCCLYRSGDALWAIDLCSSHGTRRKGKPVKVARLNHGTSFTAGATRLHFLNLHTDEVVASLSSASDDRLRGFDLERANWRQHRTILLASLGQLHDGLDRQHAIAEQETKLLVARISELESQLAAETSRREALAAEHMALRCRQEQASRETEAVWLARISELESRLAAETSRYEKLAEEHVALQRQQEQATREIESARTARIGELESQLAAETSRHEELADEHSTLRRQQEQVSREIDDMRRDYAAWNSYRARKQYDFDERDRILKSAERDATKRELELIAMKTKLRKEQEELERLRRQVQGGVELRPVFESCSAGHQGGSKIQDETCISSPHFARILDKAIESHQPRKNG